MESLSTTFAYEMAKETPGARLEKYMHALAGTTTRAALARESGISRQQLIQWFDEKGEMRFSALGEAAQRLGVRRVDLVAAYDGVTAPETHVEAPPAEAEGAVPEWAMRLLAGVISLENDAGLTEDERDRARAQAMTWLELSGSRSRRRGSDGGATGGASA